MALKFTVNGNHFTNEGGLQAMIPFAKEADALGYDYLRLLDHVVGYVAAKHPEVEATPYTHHSEFLEVFTLMAYLSAQVSNLGFITGVLGLPQRQTALVAKQAAQVDIFCGGRLSHAPARMSQAGGLKPEGGIVPVPARCSSIYSSV